MLKVSLRVWKVWKRKEQERYESKSDEYNKAYPILNKEIKE